MGIQKESGVGTWLQDVLTTTTNPTTSIGGNDDYPQYRTVFSRSNVLNRKIDAEEPIRELIE